jgi:hypothetical protein
MKIKMLLPLILVMTWAVPLTYGQTQLQFDGGFVTIDDGGLAYLRNTGNLAIIDENGGGSGNFRIFIYSTTGALQQIVALSNAGLPAGDSYLDNNMADLPNGNLLLMTTLGNVFEVSPVTGAIVPGGYGGFNVLAALGPDAETAGFAHNSATNNLWVVDDQGNPFDTITEMSPTGQVVSGPFFAIPSNLNGDAEGITFSPDLQSIFVEDGDTGNLVEITPTGQLIQTLSVTALSQGSGLPVDLDCMATDFTGGRIFITNRGANNGNVMVFTSTEVTLNIAAESFNTLRGILIGGGIADVGASDNSYLKYNPGITLNPTEPPVWVEFSATLPSAAISSLSVTLEASANTIGLQQRLEMFNFANGQYEIVDTRMATTTDSVVTVQLTGNVSRFVSSGGVIRARSGWRVAGPVSLFPWTICIDQVSWTAVQ